MAQRITLVIEGKTAEEKAYINKFLVSNKPAAYEMAGNEAITAYASNNYLPEFERFLGKMAAELKKENLPYILTAEDVGYDRYEVSESGVYHIGGYKIVGTDPDGCGPIKEYQNGKRVKVA